MKIKNAEFSNRQSSYNPENLELPKDTTNCEIFVFHMFKMLKPINKFSSRLKLFSWNFMFPYQLNKEGKIILKMNLISRWLLHFNEHIELTGRSVENNLEYPLLADQLSIDQLGKQGEALARMHRIGSPDR